MRKWILALVLVLAMVLPTKAEVYYQQDFESYPVGTNLATIGGFWSYYGGDVYAWTVMEEDGNKFVRMPYGGNSPLYTTEQFSPVGNGMSIDFDFRSDSEVWIGLRQLNLDPNSPWGLNNYADLITWWANGYGWGVRDFYDYVGLCMYCWEGVPTTNVWHHFRTEVKGSVAKIFIDGIYRTQYDFGQTLTNFQLIWTSMGYADDLDNILVQDLPPIHVNIDGQQTINLRKKGKVPVTIFSTPEFDVTTIDKDSITFGVTGNEGSVISCSLEDVNLDGLLDLACTSNLTLAGFKLGDTAALLKGQTIEGDIIEGGYPIRINK